MAYDQPNEAEEVIDAFRLGRWRKKRTELAWAFVHIMNAVHLGGHLHNDLSPDSIMFHFSDNKSKVYIGVCDWAMITLSKEPMKSLYTFTSESDMQDAMRQRWWVDPDVAYVHKKDGNVADIPSYSRASEEFAVGKLAQKINGLCMSEDYHKLQRETPTMMKISHEQLGVFFHQYLERLTKKSSDYRGGLAHVINRFQTTFNWPTPDQHFRHSY